MKTIRSTSLRFAVTLLTIVSLIAVPCPAHASVEGARIRALDLFAKLNVGLNLNVRDTFQQGLLQRGESIVIKTQLYAGKNYTLVASGCEDAYDVDIAVFDENGTFIAQDRDTDPVAVANITANYTGYAYIKVTMFNSTYDGAHFVLMYAYE